MRHINYFKLIQKAFHIAWKNKYLWWLGFFVAFGQSASVVFNYSKNDGPANQPVLDFVYSHMPIILLAAAMILLIYAVIIVLAIVGRGSIIKAAGESVKGRKMNFHSAVHQGKKYFWRLFLIGLIMGALTIGTLFVFLVPVYFFFYTKSYITGSVIAALAVIIVIPLMFLITFLRTYGYLYAVLGDLPFGEALENAYSLFRENVLTSLVALLVFALIGLILAILVGLIILPVVVIFALLSGILYLLAGAAGVTAASVFGAVVVGVILLAILSVFEVFKQALWVLFFEEIARPGVKEKVSEKEVARNINSVPNPVKTV